MPTSSVIAVPAEPASMGCPDSYAPPATGILELGSRTLADRAFGEVSQ